MVKLAKTGQLAHHLVGNRHRFNRADVLAYAEQMRSDRTRHWRPLYPSAGTPPKTSTVLDNPASARPVAVLDANILIPAGLRDPMLSCADVGVFRPVWQAEIETEVVRNSARLTATRHAST